MMIELKGLLLNYGGFWQSTVKGPTVQMFGNLHWYFVSVVKCKNLILKDASEYGETAEKSTSLWIWGFPPTNGGEPQIQAYGNSSWRL